jgi:hypothetical protein
LIRQRIVVKIQKCQCINRRKQIIDFDFLWKTKSFWSYYNTTFETKKCAWWFFCWSIATFKTLMSSLFKSFDEISSYQSRWILIKTTFIYFTNSTRIREYIFTSTISWTWTIEMSNILRSTWSHWKWKSTISMKIRAWYIFIMYTIFRSSFTRHETIRSHFRRRKDFSSKRMWWCDQKHSSIQTSLIIHSKFKRLIEVYENKWSKAKNHSKSQENQFSSKNWENDQHFYESVTINKMSEKQKSFASKNFQNVHSQVLWSYDRHI